MIDLAGRNGVPQHREGTRRLAGLLRRTANPERAARMTERARRRVARLLRVTPAEVVFTSGAAEANAAAVLGLALAGALRGRPRRVLLGATEHAPVHAAAATLRLHGFEVLELPVDGCGRVDPDAAAASMAGGAAVAAVQWANDELGVLQHLDAIGERAAAAGVPLHVDACAAVGWVPLPPGLEHAATISVSSWRMGGPAGVGALVVREGVAWRPLFDGGTEEEGRRAGRLHPALVAALGITAAAARRHRARRAARAARLRRLLERECAVEAEPTLAALDESERLPGHLHLRLRDLDAEPMLVALESRGIRAETGSPCASGGVPSRILRACGWDAAACRSALLLRAAAGHPRDTAARFGVAWQGAGQHLRALAP